MFYAKSTGGFYTIEVHGDAIPADAVEITDELYRSLLDGQSAGLVITSDADGIPYLASAPQPDPAIAVETKLNAVRAVREAMLNRMAGIALVAQIDGDTATVDAFKAARTALLDITKNPPTDPALVDAFIMVQYLVIRDALPASLVTAFAGVDL